MQTQVQCFAFDCVLGMYIHVHSRFWSSVPLLCIVRWNVYISKPDKLTLLYSVMLSTRSVHVAITGLDRLV